MTKDRKGIELLSQGEAADLAGVSRTAFREWGLSPVRQDGRKKLYRREDVIGMAKFKRASRTWNDGSVLFIDGERYASAEDALMHAARSNMLALVADLMAVSRGYLQEQDFDRYGDLCRNLLLAALMKMEDDFGIDAALDGDEIEYFAEFFKQPGNDASDVLDRLSD